MRRNDRESVVIERLETMLRQGVRVAGVAHVPEELLLNPAREQDPEAISSIAICGMGDDERHLAAIVQEAADLA